MAIVITEVSDAELEKYLLSIQAEIKRRSTLRDAENQVREINISVLRAEGTGMRQSWRQPLGAHDAYPKDWAVIYNDRVYKSTVDGNVWVPGTQDLWVELDEEAAPPEPIDAQPWVAGEDVGFDEDGNGELREFEGSIYRVVQAHTTQPGWEPPNVPALWVKIQ